MIQNDAFSTTPCPRSYYVCHFHAFYLKPVANCFAISGVRLQLIGSLLAAFPSLLLHDQSTRKLFVSNSSREMLFSVSSCSFRVRKREAGKGGSRATRHPMLLPIKLVGLWSVFWPVDDDPRSLGRVLLHSAITLSPRGRVMWW